MIKKEISDRFREIADPLLRSMELELVDVEFGTEIGRKLIRIIIDNPDGVTIDHCEAVNRRLSEELDLHEDWIPGAYNLEVSSPGFDRPFKNERDYQRNLGKLVKVVTKAPIDGQNVYVGLMDEFISPEKGREPAVVIRENESTEPVQLDLKDIAVAHLEIDWDSLFGTKPVRKKKKKGTRK